MTISDKATELIEFCKENNTSIKTRELALTSCQDMIDYWQSVYDELLRN